MTDEALAIVAAVWSGRALAHAGRHYRVDLPDGVAEPHDIPVWVAGTLPKIGSAHRAVRHDGIVLLGGDGEGMTRTPADVDLARKVLRANGLADGQPFDIVLPGNASHAWEEPKNVDLAGLAAAGMTWWLESLIHYDPLELTLAVVDAGPPRS